MLRQNRLAHVLIAGLGTPVDKVEALKWHLVAKTAGKGDPDLDDQFARLSADERAKGDLAARRWLGTAK